MFKQITNILCVSILINGCAISKIDKYESSLICHRCPVVGASAYVGFLCGFIAGLPLDIPSVPITILLNASGTISAGHEGENLLIGFFLPSALVGIATETVFATPAWLLFGWWWPEKNIAKPVLPEEKKTDRSSQGLEQRSTNPKSP